MGLRPRHVRELHPVSAASGLVRVGDWLYVVADDEAGLGIFPAEGGGPGEIRPFEDVVLSDDHAERKAAKADLEAICRLQDDTILALGSGATEQRRRGFAWRVAPDGALAGEARTVDLGPLHTALARELPDLNLEGAAVAGDLLVLLQRGNGADGANALIEVDLAAARRGVEEGAIAPEAIRSVRPVELPEAGGFPLGLTDGGALDAGRLVFTAAAEAAASTYEDGACVGAAVGVLDVATGSVLALHELAEPVKLEGVHVEGRDLLLTADADDRAVPAPLLAAELPAPG